MNTTFTTDNFLPSYEDATSQNVVTLFAPYVHRTDVFACSLVCTKWNHSFRQTLWNKPTIYWELGERSALTGFENFIKILPIASESSRNAVQILSLRDVHPTVYADIPPLWLRDICQLLPNLHTIIAGGVPFFDYNAILKTTSQEPIPRLDKLSYLNLSKLGNTNPKSLVDLLHRLTPSLVYLDLSGTMGAYNTDVLAAIGDSLQQLKTLKLQDLQINNAGIEVLAKKIGVRLESLDISGNCLSDGIVSVLLDWCFMPPEYEIGQLEDGAQIVPMELNDGSGMNGFMTEGVDWITTPTRNLNMCITNSNRQPPPEIDDVHRVSQTKGLTCLNISRNKISNAGHAKLLRSTRLRTFDCSLVDFSNKVTNTTDMVAVLNLYGSSNLNNLRIDFNTIFAINHDKPLPGTETSQLFPILKMPKLQNLALTRVPHTTCSGKIIKHLRLFLDSLTTSECALSLLTLEFSSSTSDSVEDDRLLSSFHSDSATFTRATQDDFSFFDSNDEPDGSMNSKTASSQKRGGPPLKVDIRKYDLVHEIRVWRERSARDDNRWPGTIQIKR